jgi:hypothetical protein
MTDRIERNAYRRARHAEILERRRRVMNLYCDGQTQTQIAHALGISQAQVSEDIAASIRHWRRQYGIDINALIVQEVEKLNRLEAKANAAYDLSCENKKLATISSDGVGGPPSTSATIIERKEGDMACLAMVERCIARRIRLLQLDKRRVEDEEGGEQAMTFVDFMTQWYRKQRVVEAPRLVRTGNS